MNGRRGMRVCVCVSVCVCLCVFVCVYVITRHLKIFSGYGTQHIKQRKTATTYFRPKFCLHGGKEDNFRAANYVCGVRNFLGGWEGGRERAAQGVGEGRRWQGRE